MISVSDFSKLMPDRFLRAAINRSRLRSSGTYPEFIEQLYLDIDDQLYDMQAGRELRQKDSEDRLSADIVCGLRRHGYTAVGDAKHGGHIDVSVELGEFTWIGEAKKDGNFREGFLQLMTRYVPASGNYSHNQGGLIFYFVNTPDAKGKLDSWRGELTQNGSVCSDCSKNVLAFYSDHTLQGPGTAFKVRTMGVSIFHEPKDKSARISAAKKAAKKKTA